MGAGCPVPAVEGRAVEAADEADVGDGDAGVEEAAGVDSSAEVECDERALLFGEEADAGGREGEVEADVVDVCAVGGDGVG